MKPSKTIRASEKYTLKYMGKENGVKVYTVEGNKDDGEISALFEKAVADSLKKINEEKFNDECEGLLKIETFHLEQINKN